MMDWQTKIDPDLVLDNIEEEARIIGSKINYVGHLYNKVQKQLQTLRKIEIPKYKAKFNAQFRGAQDPNTGKAYTVNGLDELRRLETEDSELKMREIELEYKAENLKAIKESLVVNANNIKNLAYIDYAVKFRGHETGIEARLF